MPVTGPSQKSFPGQSSHEVELRQRMLHRPMTADFKPRRLPWKRSLESMLSPEQMSIAIHRESARADRSGGQFAMVLFRMQTSDKAALSAVRLAKTVLKRVRATDDVGWYDDQNIAALLPDTSASGAKRFADALCMIVEKKGTRPEYSIYSYPHWMKDDTDPGAAPRRSDSPANPVDGRPLGVGNLFPYFMDGLKSEIDEKPVKIHRLEELLERPLPAWKRALDICGALFGLLVSAPVLLFAAIGIKITDPTGPVFFSQQRGGLGGRPFQIFKLRTMIVGAEDKLKELMKKNEQDGPAFKMKDDPRVTSFGKFLRKTSIDELPQLWNVVTGDMTLVGPRPLPLHETAACEGWHRRRLDVTPGLTCIWQVKGRSKVSFSEWVRMDVTYIRRRTLFNDLRILAATVPAVLLRKGAR